MELNSNIKIFPIPATDWVRVESSFDAMISIYSIFGNLIESVRHINSSQIQVSDYLPGVYIMEFRMNDQIRTERMIIR